MSRVSEVALEHCKELAMVPGSLFEFTSRFIPADRKEQLLALYALIQSVRSIPGAATDDAVKWAKLKWWSEELAAEPDSTARHPVLRALWESGARNHLENRLLLELVSGALKQIDAPPAANEEALFNQLAALGATETLLELALAKAGIGSQELACLSAASGLFAMIPGFNGSRPAQELHLPLDLVAKYQLDAAQLEQRPAGVELVAAILELAGHGVEWYAQGLSALDASGGLSTCQHLQLRWAMEARLLTRLARRAGAQRLNGNRFGPMDAWFAWRFCRELKHSRWPEGV